MADRVVRIILTGDSRGAVQALRVVGAEAEKTSSTLDRVHAAGQRMSSVGRTMTEMAVPLVGLGVASVKAAMSFQQSMLMIRTQAGQSQAEVNRMSAAIKNLAPSVATGPQALAQAMYHIESAGFHGSQALNMLKVAAQGARVGNADLTDVTNALNAAMVSHIPGVNNLKSAMGALNATVGAGDMTMQNLADAFSTGGVSSLKTYGLTIRDVGAALATMGDNNVRGQEAMTKLVSAMRIMAAPAKANAQWLAAIGMSQLQLGTDLHKPNGLVTALSDLKAHLVGLSKPEVAMVLTRIFGGRQSTGVQLLIDQLGRVKQKYAEVGAGMTGFGGSWQAYQKSPAYQWQKFQATMQADLIKLGDAIMPLAVKYLPKLANAVTSAFNWFDHLSPQLRKFLVFFTAFLAIGGPILMFTGRLVSSVATIAGVIGKLRGPLGLLGGEAGIAGGGMRGLVGGIGKLGLALAALQVAKTLAPHVKSDVQNFRRNITDPTRAFRQDLHSMVSGQQMGTGAGYTPGLMGPGGPGNALSQAWNWVAGLFHAGGPVYRASGGPIGTDTVPAWLTPGEFVLSRSTAQALGYNNLNSINATGSIPPHMTDANRPIVLHHTTMLGGRVVTQEVVHYGSRAAALSGRLGIV